mmetsp:Transcript_25457/g.61583  ORF Transcript_25457/g.61583 Transcript_25457/m.61583 type:complete len:123 (+) Transcript_25457:1472-1840(+)
MGGDYRRHRRVPDNLRVAWLAGVQVAMDIPQSTRDLNHTMIKIEEMTCMVITDRVLTRAMMMSLQIGFETTDITVGGITSIGGTTIQMKTVGKLPLRLVQCFCCLLLYSGCSIQDVLCDCFC